MARSINTSLQHAHPSPSSSKRGTLKFSYSNWKLQRIARRLGRSKKLVLKRNAPFKMTVLFDLVRPLGFQSGWSTNIKPSEDETAYVTDSLKRLFSARGVNVVTVDLAQSDVEDTYKGVSGKYLARVVVS